MNLQNADVAAFSRERSSVQQQGFVGPPSSSSSFLLSFCKLKGEERLDLDITWLIRNAKNKRGQVVGLLVCCLFVTSCVLFWEKSLLD